MYKVGDSVRVINSELGIKVGETGKIFEIGTFIGIAIDNSAVIWFVSLTGGNCFPVDHDNYIQFIEKIDEL